MKSKKTVRFEDNLLKIYTGIIFIGIFLFFFSQFGFFNISVGGLNSITGLAIGVTNIQLDQYNVNVLNSYEGDNIVFNVPVQNLGNEVINNSFADIQILDSNNNNVTNLKTNTISLMPTEKKILISNWFNSSSSGVYQIRVLVNLDKTSYSFSKLFNIDKKTLTFESIDVNNTNISDITTFDILVQNHLNDNVNNASAGLLIYDNSNNVVARLMSINQEINANSLNKVGIQWKSNNLLPGEYKAKLFINYSNNSIERNIMLNLSNNNFQVMGVGYSIAYSGTNTGTKSNSTLIIISSVLLLLILINVVWIRYYKKRFNKKKR